MAGVVVRASHGHKLCRFSIPPASPTIKYPTFQSLCEALVYNLDLPTTTAALADASRPPFNIVFRDDDTGFYYRIFDDSSLRRALTPWQPSLRVKVYAAFQDGPQEPPTTEVEERVLGHSEAADNDGHCDPPVHVFSPTSLLRLLNVFRNEGSSSVKRALAGLNRCIQCHPGDATALRRRRHELAGLFSAFLAEAALPGDSRIPKRLTAPLIDNLTASLQRAGVSKHTTTAATRAVSIMCNCKPAVELLRKRYAHAARRAAVKRSKAEAEAGAASTPDTAVAQASTAVVPVTVVHAKTRPVKHYMNQFTRMRRVGGPEVKEAYRRFEHARRRAGDMPAFDLTRKVCKSVQRASFHFLRCHVSDSDFQFEQRAVRALAASIARKLLRAGYDERLVDVTMQLVVAMATDVEVIRLAYKWANRPKDESPDEGDKAGDEEEDDEGDDEVDDEEPDDSGELEEMVLAAEEERMQIEASRMSHSNASSRRQSVHEDEEVGGDIDSNESLASVDSLNELEEIAQSQAMKKKMNKMSPIYSSEDMSPDGGSYGNGSGSEGRSSTDTEQSQWARVQMAKEREEQLQKEREEQLQKEREEQLQKARRLDREKCRPSVVIDGQNVGRFYGGHENFRSLDVKLALDYYAHKGVYAIAFLPRNKGDERKIIRGKPNTLVADDPALLNKLFREKRISFNPAGTHDDNYILAYAMRNNADIVSNDRFEKECNNQRTAQDKHALKSFLEKHLIPYTLVAADFLPNPNPSQLGHDQHKPRA